MGISTQTTSALRERSDEYQYSIELREGGEDSGLETVLSRYQSLPVARAQFKATIQKYPDRIVMLRDRTRVLARSDRSDAVSRYNHF
jgi:hypothetical protein